MKITKETLKKIIKEELQKSLSEGIEACPTIQKGDRGRCVANVQQTLIKAGYKLTADGDYGDKTHRAVEDFKKTQMKGYGPELLSSPGMLEKGLPDHLELTQMVTLEEGKKELLNENLARKALKAIWKWISKKYPSAAKKVPKGQELKTAKEVIEPTRIVKPSDPSAQRQFLAKRHAEDPSLFKSDKTGVFATDRRRELDAIGKIHKEQLKNAIPDSELKELRKFYDKYKADMPSNVHRAIGSQGPMNPAKLIKQFIKPEIIKKGPEAAAEALKKSNYFKDLMLKIKYDPQAKAEAKRIFAVMAATAAGIGATYGLSKAGYIDKLASILGVGDKSSKTDMAAKPEER